MKAGPTSDDFMMLDWLDATESDYVIVATKSDKLNRTDYALALTELEKLGVKGGAGRGAENRFRFFELSNPGAARTRSEPS